ncbi:methyltransferase domain-containing protein [Dyella kyungheensis]|uniref:class I SAM-dependent methyltransferase n=1 Tax=Dyella kyungheensis TaxID=1242174 RepID=UPI003CF17B19
MTECWCGSTEFVPFSSEYVECGVCGTLISLVGLTPEQLAVKDDETDFYGKEYWLGHQSEDLGFPDIYRRTRADLTERNLHWLKALLKYRLPGAKVMELGCSHGSFVALMQQAGYNASGVEMSPWVVEFGKRTFQVPIFVGPIEGLDIPDGSLDVIALMDVMEHLPDPVATMAHCLKLLKPDGVLLVQTPKFRPGMNYAELVETNGAFLEQLKADEHLYLFTEESAKRLFRQLGAEHIQFEPAIFSQYDMFFAVSRIPLHIYTPEEGEEALTHVPNGRITLALLDLRARELATVADAVLRGEQIETLTNMVQQSHEEAVARAHQIEVLTSLVKESEADRHARGQQIWTLTDLVKESEADRDARGKQIEILTGLLKESEADRDARGKQVITLTDQLKESDAARNARIKQAFPKWVKESEARLDAQLKKIECLSEMLNEPEADRLARAQQIETLAGLLKGSEAAHAARNAQIEALQKLREESAEDRVERDRKIEDLTHMLKQSEMDGMARDQQISAFIETLKRTSVEKAEQDERIAVLLEDVRSLFDRRSFRTMAKFAR